MALVQPTDVSYLGFFTLPEFAGTPTGQTNSMHNGGFALGIGPSNTIYVGGYQDHGRLARFTIPAIGDEAPVVNDLTFVPGTFDTSVGADHWLGGSLVWNNRLIVTKWGTYSQIENPVASHTSATPEMTGWTTPQAANSIPTCRTAAGYMGVIPPEWRAAFGKPCFTGSGPRSVDTNGSFGPSLFGFDPDDVDGSGIISTIPYLFYDDPHQMMLETSLVGGCGWVGDSVFFVGTKALGTWEYGDAPPIFDPCNPSSGMHQYPYTIYMWIYDANDLLAVRNGTAQSWDPAPYAEFELTGYNTYPCARILHRGGCYDPATSRYYFCDLYASQPKVHVWEIAGSDPPPASTPSVLTPVYVPLL